MDSASSIHEDPEKTKNSLRMATNFYLILLPFAAIFAVGSLLGLGSPSPILMTLIGIFLYWCIPLSIPITLWLMWRAYSKGNYKKSRHLRWIPIYVIALLFLYGYFVNIFLV